MYMTSAGNVYEDVDRDMHVDSEQLVWCYTHSGNELFMSEDKMGHLFLVSLQFLNIGKCGSTSYIGMTRKKNGGQ